MATFVDLILKGTKLDEAVKQQLADRVMHVVENCDKSAVLESARLDEANMVNVWHTHLGTVSGPHLVKRDGDFFRYPDGDMLTVNDDGMVPVVDAKSASKYDGINAVAHRVEPAISSRINEANMIPSKREAVVAFATQHYNKTHGTNFPKHDIHAHLYGGEAPEFADHVERHANPEAADHLEKNFGLKKNAFMEGEDEVAEYSIFEQEDAPDNAIPPLSKEAVKKLLTTYQKRNLPAEYNIDEFLPKSPEGAARASATAGEDVPPVAHPAGPSPQDAYKNWFTNQGV